METRGIGAWMLAVSQVSLALDAPSQKCMCASCCPRNLGAAIHKPMITRIDTCHDFLTCLYKEDCLLMTGTCSWQLCMAVSAKLCSEMAMGTEERERHFFVLDICFIFFNHCSCVVSL